mgnify:CR=1 FL=1
MRHFGMQMTLFCLKCSFFVSVGLKPNVINVMLMQCGLRIKIDCFVVLFCIKGPVILLTSKKFMLKCFAIVGKHKRKVMTNDVNALEC